jgi:hypothetical protein
MIAIAILTVALSFILSIWVRRRPDPDPFDDSGPALQRMGRISGDDLTDESV